MYLRPKEENKRICKVCGEKGFVDSCNPIFICPVCHWIEDKEQEENPDSRKGKNKKTFSETKKIYEENWVKYGSLINKEIKVIMKSGEIKQGYCRDYRCDSLLIPDNGIWIYISDIQSIEII